MYQRPRTSNIVIQHRIRRQQSPERFRQASKTGGRCSLWRTFLGQLLLQWPQSTIKMAERGCMVLPQGKKTDLLLPDGPLDDPSSSYDPGPLGDYTGPDTEVDTEYSDCSYLSEYTEDWNEQRREREVSCHPKHPIHTPKISCP